MSEFWLWFTTGLQHILDFNGYDHICYVAALTVVFSVQDFRKILVLVTAFTLGHSLTLALSVTNLVRVPQLLIECLIPLTIIATSVFNLRHLHHPPKRVIFSYATAAFFGLIHGMGFSYLLKSLLGKEENILLPLFSFNVGLEVGQLLIVILVLVISLILQSLFKVTRKQFVATVSVFVMIIALLLLVQRIIDIR